MEFFCNNNDNNNSIIPAAGSATMLLLLLALLSSPVVLGLLLLRAFVLRPESLRRALLQQGFRVVPCTPIAGDVIGMVRMETASLAQDLPSPSHHHLLFPYLFPFYHKRHSDLGGGDEPFVVWLGSHPTLVLIHPEDVKNALSSEIKYFKKPDYGHKVFQQLLGSGGLILAYGDDWQNQRDILRPAFFVEKLKEMVADMVASALEMVSGWDEQVARQGCPTEVEVAKNIKAATADILARTLFGSSYLKGREVFENQVQLLEYLSKTMFQNIVIPGYSFLPTSANCKCKELEKRINEELHEIVKSRRDRIQNESRGADSYGSDLLGLILAAEGQVFEEGSHRVCLSNRQVIDECKGFFFAGHETTANLLAWTMVMLSLNQEWQDRARDEVLDICGKMDQINADQVNRLKIVGMILNETLRLYPPVPEYGRRVLLNDGERIKLGHRTLPKGATITVASLFIHRRKDLWGEDADEFRPERFMHGVAKACKHPHGFMPFGFGPRICIGQHFALMEAKVIMALILQRFRFSLSPNYRHAPVASITMRPKHGVQVILETLQ